MGAIYDTPADGVYVVLQDHGTLNSGWGIAAWEIPGIPGGPKPLVYSGTDERAIAGLADFARLLYEQTGKQTLLARYTNRDVIASYGGPL